MSKTELQTLVEKIKKNGPTRIVANADGYCMTPDMALNELLLVPDVIFIRQDGWSLGAPLQFANVARDMWLGEWVTAIQV